MPPSAHAELLTPRQLAARWGLSEKTLERWRRLGTGPAFVKLGSRVLYPRDDVDAYELRQTRRCTVARGIGEGVHDES